MSMETLKLIKRPCDGLNRLRECQLMGKRRSRDQVSASRGRKRRATCDSRQVPENLEALEGRPLENTKI